MWDAPVLKVNYALDAPIPWRSKNLTDVGTVHLGADQDGLIRWMADLNTATLPEHPFLLFGQMTTADATRSPRGTESAWAYTHLPRNSADDQSAERLAARVDEVLERHAPGFIARMVGKDDHSTAIGPGVRRRQSARRCRQRGHLAIVSAVGVSSGTGVRPGRDTGAQRLSRKRRRLTRRGRAWDLRAQRRPGRVGRGWRAGWPRRRVNRAVSKLLTS